MTDEALFDQMKTNALNYAKDYSLEAIAKDVEEVYYTAIQASDRFNQ